VVPAAEVVVAAGCPKEKPPPGAPGFGVFPKLKAISSCKKCKYRYFSKLIVHSNLQSYTRMQIADLKVQTGAILRSCASLFAFSRSESKQSQAPPTRLINKLRAPAHQLFLFLLLTAVF